MDEQLGAGNHALYDFELEPLHKAWRSLASQEGASSDRLPVRLVGEVPGRAVIRAPDPERCCGMESGGREATTQGESLKINPRIGKIPLHPSFVKGERLIRHVSHREERVVSADRGLHRPQQHHNPISYEGTLLSCLDITIPERLQHVGCMLTTRLDVARVEKSRDAVLLLPALKDLSESILRHAQQA